MAITLSPTTALTFNDGTTAVTGGNVTATGAYTLPVGTTAQRPGTPATGMLRYNTTLSKTEFYNGSSWSQL
jgi:hypothetical protein